MAWPLGLQVNILTMGPDCNRPAGPQLLGLGPQLLHLAGGMIR